MTIYVTYITLYRGNKLPPFYIGYTSKEKIGKGYRGSVTSKKYKDIWKLEIKNNPHLFKTKIIKEFTSKLEAILHEEKIHIQFNVDNNPLYTNMIKSRHYWANNGGYKLTKEQRENRKWSDERKRNQSSITTNKNKEVWGSYSDEQRTIRSENISKSLKGRNVHNKGIVRTEVEKKSISEGTKKAMGSENLRKHLSEKAKQRGINKICCLECKKIIIVPNFGVHIEKHDGIKRIYVNNGIKQIKIKENIDEIPEGYTKGRLK
jgi:hypothetical protein